MFLKRCKDNTFPRIAISSNEPIFVIFIHLIDRHICDKIKIYAP